MSLIVRLRFASRICLHAKGLADLEDGRQRKSWRSFRPLKLDSPREPSRYPPLAKSPHIASGDLMFTLLSRVI